MSEGSDKHDEDAHSHVYRDVHARRMQELEQELDIARKQAEIEKARAEAVVNHLAVENQHLRQRPPPLQQAPPVRRNPLWLVAGRIVGQLGSMLLGLISCLSFLLLIVLVYAYWPEISAMIGMDQLPIGENEQ